jgi:hypothetical protein
MGENSKTIMRDSLNFAKTFPEYDLRSRKAPKKLVGQV